MTASEMKKLFLVLYDAISSFDSPGFTDTEISILLTKAQERILLTSYRKLSNSSREGFEEVEKRRKEISPLVKPARLTDLGPSDKENGRLYSIPDDLYLVVHESVETDGIECVNDNEIRILPMSHDEYSINIKNPFKKPHKGLIWRLDIEGKHELINDGTFNIVNYNIRYITKPKPIIVGTIQLYNETGPLNCELHEIAHNRVVEEAVSIASAITSPEKYEIKQFENLKNE